MYIMYIIYIIHIIYIIYIVYIVYIYIYQLTWYPLVSSLVYPTKSAQCPETARATSIAELPCRSTEGEQNPLPLWQINSLPWKMTNL
jgi:hypothetical protein